MPTWLKILLIIFLAGVLLLIAAVYVGYRWVRSHEGELREMNDKAVAEAQEFGRGKDADACIVETLSRGDRCGQMDMFCEVKAKIFLENCLKVATVPDDFCASVPKQTNIMGSVRWQMAECGKRGHANEQRCTRLIAGVQEHCDP